MTEQYLCSSVLVTLHVHFLFISEFSQEFFLRHTGLLSAQLDFLLAELDLFWFLELEGSINQLSWSLLSRVYPMGFFQAGL